MTGKNKRGFNAVRVWLWRLFDKYVDITEEVRVMLNPTPDDKLVKRIQGALKQTISHHGGAITISRIEKAARVIAAELRNGNGLGA